MLPTLSKTIILGVPISRIDLGSTIQFAHLRAEKRLGGYFCFANVHTVTEARQNPEVLRVLSEATLSVPDGLPLVWVSKLGSHPVASRVCGPDFMTKYLADYPNERCGFIGGMPGQSELLIQKFGLSGVGYSPPMRPFSTASAEEDWRAFLALAGGVAPATVWVGLGAPKQEYWMNVVSRLAPETLFFGVGAAFDFLSDRKKRAPLWMQKNGLEWAYRLFQEPSRLWKRYLKTNAAFIGYLILDFFQKKRLKGN